MQDDDMDSIHQYHQRTAAKTYAIVGITFALMIGLNLYAFMTIMEMTQIGTTLANASTKLKLNSFKANLYFREYVSGDSSRDLNEVWDLLEGAKNEARVIGEVDKDVDMIFKLEAFKNAMLSCVKESDQLSEKKDLIKNFKNSFAELDNYADELDKRIDLLVQDKLDTFKLIYIVLLLNTVFLLYVIFMTFRSYIKRSGDTEMKLEDMHSSLNSVINSINAMIITIGDNGLVSEWNSAAAKYFKIPEENAIGQAIWELVPFLMSYKFAVTKVAQTRKDQEFYRELITTDKERFFNIVISPLVTGSGVVIRMNDVTIHELQDEQVRQTQKMQVVENLVGGLAHNFNNVIGAIKGTVSMMRYTIDTKQSLDDIRHNLDVIESSSERAEIMVKQLLAISKKQRVELRPIDLNEILTHVIGICENTFDKRIELTAELYEVKTLTKADPAQLEQVLLNICDNALQAMTTMRKPGEIQGGSLRIDMEIVYVTKEFKITHPSASHDSYWMIKVADTGVGMDRGTLSRIFDPFFSTKGESTGLGLTMVHDIVQRHEGFVDVESQIGRGTIFKIYLPELSAEEAEEMAAIAVQTASAKAAAKVSVSLPEGVVTEVAAPEKPSETTTIPPTHPSAHPAVAAIAASAAAMAQAPKRLVKTSETLVTVRPRAEDIPRGSGLVLVVDDELGMRRAAEGILKKLGYDVKTAEDGLEGVELFKANAGQVKAVLLDMAMPKMSGREAFIEMKKLDPEVKVLMASGFEYDERMEEVIQLGIKGYLPKPYNLLQLATEIKKIIDEKPV